ncbi:MAG TPA: hypothetical protein VEA37_05360, partial [Flavobacterium sp.]|nr:hypothetical protein [Flavobacterium sp.]
TKIYPDDSRGWRAFASALYELKAFEQALAAYNTAISLCLHIKYNRLNTAKARIRFNNAKIANYLFAARVNRAGILFELGSYKESIRAYEKILSREDTLNDVKPEHYIKVIEACDQLGLTDKQLSWIETGLNRHPGDPQLIIAYARWLLKDGQLNDSLRLYGYVDQKEIQDVPFYSEYLGILKKNYYMNLFNKVYPKAIQLKPITSYDNYHYGHILYMSGNIQEAKQYYLKSNDQELPWYSEMW